MAVGCERIAGIRSDLKLVGCGNFLFAAGAAAIIAGLLFPNSIHPPGLDILLVFGASLTAAILVIIISAESALQVLGLPMLIVIVTVLRLIVSTASMKFILSQAEAGTIIGFLGGILTINNSGIAIAVFGFLVLVWFLVVCKAVKNINSTSTRYLVNTFPVKQASIESSIEAGIINEETAVELKEKAAQEAGFFTAIGSASKFMFFAAAAELSIVIINMVGSTAVKAATGISIRTYTTVVIGAAITAQLPALIVAMACKYFADKSFSSADTDDKLTEEELSERIKVVSREISSNQCVDIEQASKEPIKPQQQQETMGTQSDSSERIITAELTWLDEKTEQEEVFEEHEFWDWRAMQDEGCYDAVADLIESRLTVDNKIILMAAENTDELGVTVPVNVAMQMAERGQKTLLIDLDSERAAISKVFDIKGAAAGKGKEVRRAIRQVPTCINNLWVLQITGFCKSLPSNIIQIISKLEGRYDRVVIYAPNIKLLPNCAQLSRRVRTAMLFGSENKAGDSTIGKFERFLSDCNCHVLEPQQVLAAVG